MDVCVILEILAGRADLCHHTCTTVADEAHALHPLSLGTITPKVLRFVHVAGREASHLLARQVEHVVSRSGNRIHANHLTDSHFATFVRILGILACSKLDVVDVHPVASHGKAKDMLTSRESHLLAHVGEAVIAFARNREFADNFAIDGERECTFAFGSN